MNLNSEIKRFEEIAQNQLLDKCRREIRWWVILLVTNLLFGTWTAVTVMLDLNAEWAYLLAGANFACVVASILKLRFWFQLRDEAETMIPLSGYLSLRGDDRGLK